MFKANNTCTAKKNQTQNAYLKKILVPLPQVQRRTLFLFQIPIFLASSLNILRSWGRSCLAYFLLAVLLCRGAGCWRGALAVTHLRGSRTQTGTALSPRRPNKPSVPAAYGCCRALGKPVSGVCLFFICQPITGGWKRISGTTSHEFDRFAVTKESG